MSEADMFAVQAWLIYGVLMALVATFGWLVIRSSMRTLRNLRAGRHPDDDGHYCPQCDEPLGTRPEPDDEGVTS